VLVISHASGDEGDVYYERIIDYAKRLNVRIANIDYLIGTQREVAMVRIAKNLQLTRFINVLT